jgi:hypothetical protein
MLVRGNETTVGSCRLVSKFLERHQPVTLKSEPFIFDIKNIDAHNVFALLSIVPIR